MKELIRANMVLHQIRPGVYEDESGTYREWFFGEIVKDRRQQLKMTQQELADRIGVNIGTVSRYESGKIAKPSLERKQQFAKALDCTVDYLDSFTDNPHESLYRPEKDQETERIMALFSRLSPDQKAAVEAIMKTMVLEE